MMICDDEVSRGMVDDKDPPPGLNRLKPNNFAKKASWDNIIQLHVCIAAEPSETQSGRECSKTKKRAMITMILLQPPREFEICLSLSPYIRNRHFSKTIQVL